MEKKHTVIHESDELDPTKVSSYEGNQKPVYPLDEVDPDADDDGSETQVSSLGEPHKKRMAVKFKKELVDKNIILSVRHLKQFFKLAPGLKTKAVHDVSFDVYKGESFGLVGESGCGKTTTGRSLIRLYDITSGSVYFKGYRISAGTRWNTKEIQWTKKRAKKKIGSLKAQIEEIVNNNELKDEEKNKQIEVINTQINDVKAHVEEVIKTQTSKIKQIKYDNKHVDQKLLNKIQMIFQDPIDSLDPRMTVEDIIQEGLKIQSSNRWDKASRIFIRTIKKCFKKVEDARYTDDFDAVCQAQEEILFDKISSNYKADFQLVKRIHDCLNQENKWDLIKEFLDEEDKIRKDKNRRSNHEKVVEVLEKVGLIADYTSRYPHEFSGGQRQRIGIARAIVMKPELLICDEPISALDVSIRAQVLNLLNDLRNEMDLTLLFIAHDLSVVKYFCNRIAVMYYGEIVELATSDELFLHPLHPYTKALLSAIPHPDPLSEKTRERKIYIPSRDHDYSKESPKLTEILPGHFVLANSFEIEKYKSEIESIDSHK